MPLKNEILNSFFKPHLDLIAEQSVSLYANLNECELENVIRTFRKHPRVIFCTLGKKAMAAQKIVLTAQSFGLDWHNLHSVTAFHGDLGIVKRGDLLVFVSKSGGTEETNKLAEYLADWEKIAITSGDNSCLAGLCDHKLIIPVVCEGGPTESNAPFMSTFLYMGVLHGILIDAIESSSIDTKKMFARNHPAGKIGEAIRKSQEVEGC